MIQEYLNEQFIQIADDANFDKIKKTSSDVAKKIAKDKSKILSYSLVAFDPEISADNPEIVEIKSLIIENWQTFFSNSKDTALTIIRAIMLDALKTASNDLSSACLIWFSSRNIFKYYKLGREQDILTKFLLELGNNIESKASESWSFSPDDTIATPKIAAAVLNATDLTTHVQPNAIDAAGMAGVINKVLKKQAAEIQENQNEFIRLNSLMHMRTQLLWWKEANYSSLLKTSYAELNNGMLQIVLAYDYSNFIPDLYPVSVDYFLLENHKNLSSANNAKHKISEFLEMVENSTAILKNIITESTEVGGRISFVNFTNGFIHGRYKANQFKSLVGVDDSFELTLGEITLWLFHDLHSIKLSKSK
ncbi:MAG: hypothetical protein EOO43_00870 [Flavobacterium sp.]|nr:MAG: hypothetical protein EOO43_00870 [Flavobacterium sp.]